MNKQSTEVELSPLDQIRQTEAEVTRKIAAAREAAERTLQDAYKQAEDLKRMDREVGSQEGQARYREIISKAEEEAKLLMAEVHERAKKLHRYGRQQMLLSVSYIIELVIGMAQKTNE
jgi:vacuolar-type H+-ATPase subunit H